MGGRIPVDPTTRPQIGSLRQLLFVEGSSCALGQGKKGVLEVLVEEWFEQRHGRVRALPADQAYTTIPLPSENQVEGHAHDVAGSIEARRARHQDFLPLAVSKSYPVGCLQDQSSGIRCEDVVLVWGMD